MIKKLGILGMVLLFTSLIFGCCFLTPQPPQPTATPEPQPKAIAAPAAQPAPPPPPAKPTPPPIDKIALKVNFDFDKYNIKNDAEGELQKAIDFVKKYPMATFTIDGHTDYVGTEKYNQKLSEKRADSVLKYLTQKGGFDKARFTVKGYGKTKPIADNKTKKGRAENRRVELSAFSQ